ncbi:site-specific integrase [Micromonospora sp. RTP1Z1]|uniref:tyrosine-type recombinase/integrase n=1 Tax=Micromonospora sp. RTP1Z1 TaxID=2994043 RepID=UPI0029C5FE41|nr:site-specific integrase [Micromonospora sp. RTP1Z1]
MERDIAAIALPKWGHVVSFEGVVPWLVVDDGGVPVEPIRVFLRDFVARGNRPGSVRSYAYALLRWWRWLRVVGVEWDRATSAEVRDLVLWLGQAVKDRNSPRVASAATAGTVNLISGKRYLDDRFGPRTIRHGNAIIRSFYVFWIELGEGPLVNPVVLARARGGRRNAHHNPMQLYRPEGRIRYNPKLPKRRPRAMSDEQWLDLFAGLRSNRDRALLALAVSNAARAGELLGIRCCDLDWGEQLVRVRRKGSGAEQWLPASADAFVWLRLWLAEAVTLTGQDVVWQTLRRRDRGQGLAHQPLTYDALRAVLRRANHLLGTNWTMHDLRHTCALRMARDKRLSLRDVQVILGHAHLSTTADIYLVEDDEAVIERVVEHLSARQQPAPRMPAPRVGYDADDLRVLFGGDLR